MNDVQAQQRHTIYVKNPFNVKGKTTGTSRQQSHYLKNFRLHVYGGLQENQVSTKP